MKNPKHILLVKNRAMGDAIMGISALQYLRQLYPESKISYAVPSWIAPLFENVGSAADEIIPLDLKSLSKSSKLFFQLLSSDIDYIHECHLSGSSYKFFRALSLLKRIPYSFHNHHLKKGKVIDQGITKALIQRDLDGLYTFLGNNFPQPHFENFEPRLKSKLGSATRKQIVFGVVATRETKMWPIEFYNKLAGMIYDDLGDIEILIPLSTSDFDQSLKKFFTTSVTFVETSLNNLPEILAGSLLYIGNDTGLKHLCVALEIPTYTLFGPEPPLEWHPYAVKKHRYYFRHPLSCRTEKYHYCPLSTCTSMICLNQFEAKDAWGEAKALVSL
jgi:heptosyltransferase II